MRKYLLALLLALTLVLALAATASANGGPHGGYTATTDACAGCHRAHTAVGPKLLVQTSTYALCTSCHGNAGTGADSNVIDGVWLEGRNPSDTTGDANTANNAALLGGGFTNYRGVATTSNHDVTGTVLLAWGNGVNRGVAATLGVGNEMDCASCHDPHGSPNYRIFAATVNSVAVTVAQVDEGAAKDYDTEQWGAGQSSFCAACHGSYHRTAAGQGSTLDNGTYTHRIDMANAPAVETVGYGGYTLPLGESGTQNRVVCQTCHLPHGSSAAMTGFADPSGGWTPGTTDAADSSLLRIDNRGVCEVCHQK
ncbi:MAG: cytochrome c3 family protein [Chloroflexota bacterium]